ncbi:MAG: flagellar hook-basal body protein [Magnetococcales bacterium]|nr:flagellar hook-basal body protein [Magnetococcales bacterium]
MDSGLFAAANGALRAEMKLEVLGNNLANVNTNGYKQDHISFASYMTSPGKEQHPLPNDSFLGTRSPVDIPFPYLNPASNAYRVTYPQAVKTTPDMTDGRLQNTNNPLDVAITGEGFFVVETPQGRRFTRDGAFVTNSAGELSTRDGHRVLGEGDAPLVVGEGPVEIAPDGTVASANGVVGRLQRVGAPVETLAKAGKNLFDIADRRKEVNLAGTPGGFQQGFLEGSNMEPVKGMTQMIETNRAFETYMKLIKSLDGLDELAANQIGKLQG